MANILFISSIQDAQSITKPLQTPEQIQFGISYISTFLKKSGHSTHLIVLTRETSVKLINKTIEQYKPLLICFTSVFSEYETISKMADIIKKQYPLIFLLAGGAHVSLNPENCINDSFDAICIGEGEYPTLELIEKLEKNEKPENILNLWIKGENQIIKNPTRPFLDDLDSLPFPDRQIWEEWITLPDARCSVLLGRGCPFQCAYCSNHALARLSKGKYVRFRSPENIVSEIKELINQKPFLAEIYLEVETISINKEFAIKLGAEIKEMNSTLKNPISFGVNIRITPSCDFDEIFSSLKKANFTFINIGVESGCEKVRKEILRRNYSNDDIVRTVECARKYGFRISFYNLVGLPGETIENFRETIEINRRCLPDLHALSIFFPYPGTDLYTQLKEKGLLKGPIDTKMERSKAVIDMPHFPKKQILNEYIWFDYNVYKGFQPFHRIIARVLIKKIKSNYHINRLFRNLTNIPLFMKLKNFMKKY